MAPDRHRDLILDLVGIALMLPLVMVPFITNDVMWHSLTYQTAIGIAATMAIYVMLRMGLLSFTVPAFMAVGGYAAAFLAKSGTTDLLILMCASFILPALFAVPLGSVVLRLKGVYFIFITFITNEILQILIFETPGLTGGSNGIAGFEPATLFGYSLGTPRLLVFVTVLIALVAALITFAVTNHFRAEFTSIEENETLAESLGVRVAKFRTFGFVASAGVAGLAGFALVNMISTAHPSSFSSWSVNNYIAYAFVGGRGSLLGMVAGSALLIVLSTYLSAYAHLSAGLFGLLLVIVMMAAPSGIVGSAVGWFERSKSRRTAVVMNASGDSA